MLNEVYNISLFASSCTRKGVHFNPKSSNSLEQFLQAESMSGYSNLKPYSNALFGITFCPSVMIFARSSPNAISSANFGTGNRAGRHIAFPNASENSLFVMICKYQTVIHSSHLKCVFTTLLFMATHLWGYTIQDPCYTFIFYRELNEPCNILNMNPWKVLASRCYGPSKSKEKWQIQLLNHTSLSS